MTLLTQILLVSACLVAVQSWPAFISPDVSPDKVWPHVSFTSPTHETGHKDEPQKKEAVAPLTKDHPEALPHPWQITDAFEQLADQIRHQDPKTPPHPHSSSDQAHVRYFQRIE